MTTDSNLPERLVLIFSQNAKDLDRTKTFRVRANGEIHEFQRMMDADDNSQPHIIPYFWRDTETVVINSADIERTRGSNELPKLGEVVSQLNAEDKKRRDAQLLPYGGGAQVRETVVTPSRHRTVRL